MNKVRITNLMKDMLPLALKRDGLLVIENLLPKRSKIFPESELLPDTDTKVAQKKIKLEYLSQD